MSDKAVREATAGDFDAIAVLNREVQGLHADRYPQIFKPPSAETLPRAVFEEWLADRHVFVALDDERVVGYLQARILEREENPYRFEGRSFYIDQVAVATPSRHQGHARRLIQAARARARELGFVSMELDTWAFNTPAQECFAREGFRPSLIRMSAPAES